jgi:DNA adenine methylase
VETYNDIDGEVVNFFRVLRDQKDELIYAIGMTPFSREEFIDAIETNGNGDHLSDLERARRFFVRARQVRTGLAQTASAGRWANCLHTSRAGMAGSVSRWLGSVEALEWIATRLLRVQIEHDDALNVIKRYDSEETIFYCDPPYPHDSRGDSKAYQYEMTDEEHIELFHALANVKGKVAISGYHGELMDGLYSSWYVCEASPKKVHSVKTTRTEILWTNYPVSEAMAQRELLKI